MITADDIEKAIQKIESMESKPLIKGRECVDCKWLFRCPGKPYDVELCLHFSKREKENVWE